MNSEESNSEEGNMENHIEKESDHVLEHTRPGFWAYLISSITIAASFAYPITEGGVHNIACFVAWGYVWVLVPLLIVSCFTGPLKTVTDANLVERVIFEGAPRS